MSCDTSNVINIVKGEDISFNVYLKDSDGKPYDVTGATITFEAVATPNISKAATIVDASSGNISVTLTDTETGQFDEGYVDFEIIILDGTDTRIAQFEKGILAKARLVS